MIAPPYPLAQAMADGFVKEPAVVTRKDFNHATMEPMNATVRYTPERCEVWTPVSYTHLTLPTISSM